MTQDSWIHRPAKSARSRQMHSTDISKLGGWSADGTGTSQNKATEWVVDEPRPYHTRNGDDDYDVSTSITTILFVSFIFILLMAILLIYWRIMNLRRRRHHNATGGARSENLAESSKRQTPQIRREKILAYFESSNHDMILNKNNLPAGTSRIVDIESPATHDDDDDAAAAATATEKGNAEMEADAADMACPREEAADEKCTTDDTTKQPQTTRLKPTDTACAICMEEYTVDDLVVYSSASTTTGGCPHMFHKDCFVDYLVAYRGDDGYGSPCPTCRQPFCSPTMFHDGDEDDDDDSEKPPGPRRSSGGPAGEVRSSSRDGSSRQSSDGVSGITESTISDSVILLGVSASDGESQQVSSSHDGGDI